SRVHARRFRLFAVAFALPIVACGGVVTQKHWNVLRAQYAAEGQYYVAHPDRLLYSEVPASWYLDGLRSLYAIPVRHHVTRDDKPKVLADQLAEYHGIWRYS